MIRNPFVTEIPSGRLHLSLRTVAANDNLPLAAASPPAQADGNASTRWPILGHATRRHFFAKRGAVPAPSPELGVEAGTLKGARP